MLKNQEAKAPMAKTFRDSLGDLHPHPAGVATTSFDLKWLLFFKDVESVSINPMLILFR